MPCFKRTAMLFVPPTFDYLCLMNKSLTPAQKLDEVLKVLNDDDSPIEGVSAIKEKLPISLTGISHEELTLILMSLQKTDMLMPMFR